MKRLRRLRQSDQFGFDEATSVHAGEEPSRKEAAIHRDSPTSIVGDDRNAILGSGRCAEHSAQQLYTAIGHLRHPGAELPLRRRVLVFAGAGFPSVLVMVR